MFGIIIQFLMTTLLILNIFILMENLDNSTTWTGAKMSVTIQIDFKLENRQFYTDTISSAFGGYISSVSMYNRALTASEITQNYNATRGRYGI